MKSKQSAVQSVCFGCVRVCVCDIEYLAGTIFESAESGLLAPSFGSTTTKKACCMNCSLQNTLQYMFMHYNKQCSTRRSKCNGQGRVIDVLFLPNSVNITPLL